MDNFEELSLDRLIDMLSETTTVFMYMRKYGATVESYGLVQTLMEQLVAEIERRKTFHQKT